MQNAKWSRQIRATKDLAACCSNGHDHCYRKGEIPRLYSRIDQLTERLPVQTTTSQMPIVNSLGGSELFRNGKDSLQPELHYWYGIAGINRDKETKLFLKGNNFSVHDTHVMAGDKILDFKLISREIMVVTVPAGVLTWPRSQYVRPEGVDVHIATPYGVTGRLHVPFAEEKSNKTGTPGFTWRVGNHQLKYTLKPAATTGDEEKTVEAFEHIRIRRPHAHSIQVPSAAVPLIGKTNVTLKIKATIVDGSAFATADAPTDVTVNFYRKSSLVVIEKGNFVTLHNELKTIVQNHFKTKPVSSVPPIVDVELHAVLTINGVELDVENVLKLQVLVEKP